MGDEVDFVIFAQSARLSPKGRACDVGGELHNRDVLDVTAKLRYRWVISKSVPLFLRLALVISWRLAAFLPSRRRFYGVTVLKIIKSWPKTLVSGRVSVKRWA